MSARIYQFPKRRTWPMGPWLFDLGMFVLVLCLVGWLCWSW